MAENAAPAVTNTYTWDGQLTVSAVTDPVGTITSKVDFLGRSDELIDVWGRRRWCMTRTTTVLADQTLTYDVADHHMGTKRGWLDDWECHLGGRFHLDGHPGHPFHAA